ncbi:DUF3954 domain-containing protein [Pontibacillus salicampi]|uniref:DUF3954 domain-containing protein n=1 Tax=Pontibacillus salicampi TaxID=1449801 RepID=A0ABV6LTZ3_9BACI
MSEAAENYNVMIEQIDLSENATYVVKNGALHKLPDPESGHGTQIINWQGGKPCHGKIEQSFKF